MRYSLAEEEWRVTAVHPYVPYMGKSMETGAALSGIFEPVPCQAPGGVHLAMYQAGRLAHPYYEMNSLQCEWLENKWWVYETTFTKPELLGRRILLVFDGVDYEADIYLNDQWLGAHTGMYEGFSFDITELFARHHTFTLKVLIKSAPD